MDDNESAARPEERKQAHTLFILHYMEEKVMTLGAPHCTLTTANNIVPRAAAAVKLMDRRKISQLPP